MLIKFTSPTLLTVYLESLLLVVNKAHYLHPCHYLIWHPHKQQNGLEQTDREDLWNMYGRYSHCREDTRAVTLRHSFREVVSWVSNIMWIWWVDDCPIAQYRTYTVDVSRLSFCAGIHGADPLLTNTIRTPAERMTILKRLKGSIGQIIGFVPEKCW